MSRPPVLTRRGRRVVATLEVAVAVAALTAVASMFLPVQVTGVVICGPGEAPSGVVTVDDGWSARSGAVPLGGNAALFGARVIGLDPMTVEVFCRQKPPPPTATATEPAIPVAVRG